MQMQKESMQLCTIFQDDTFAWELLNAQIQIQMSPIAQGEVIAYLLQLYMRGVQKMNSLGDHRQSYFKNKVTSLMTKQTVIRSLKEKPMKKKNKPGESDSNLVKNTSTAKRKQEEEETKQLELVEKRKQLEMRMAYVAEEHGPEKLRKLLAQEDHREQNITRKIDKILNSHEEKLNERIKRRKLRTATFKSHSEVNVQEDNQFLFKSQEKKQETSPFEAILIKAKGYRKGSQDKMEMHNIRKRHKSLEVVISESPQKRTRKLTYDKNPRQSFS